MELQVTCSRRAALHLLGLEQLHGQQQLLHLTPQLLHRLLGLRPGPAAERHALRARRCRGARFGVGDRHGGPVERRRVGQGVRGRLRERRGTKDILSEDI